MYTITRQAQWPEGTLIVEISEGGIDYCNPDALVQKYDGEFCEYEDPREAVKIALDIAAQWQKDSDEKIVIGHGGTGGYTMPFEPSEKEGLIKWAEKEYAKLDKCPACGEIMQNTKEWYQDGLKYCSEYCAEKSSEFFME